MTTTGAITRHHSDRTAARLGPTRLRRAQIAADAVAIVLGHIVAFAIQGRIRPLPTEIRYEHLLLAMAVVPVWLIALGANKLYAARAVERQGEEMRRLLVAGAVATGVLVGIGFIIQYDLLSRLMVGLLFACATLALMLERRLVRRVFAWLRSSGRLRRRVAIIGTDDCARGLLDVLHRRPELGYEVVGYIGDEPSARRPEPGDPPWIGRFDATPTALAEHGCVGAIVSIPAMAPERLNRLTRCLTDRGFHIALSTGLHDIDLDRIRPQALDGRTLVYVEPRIRTGWRRIAKRGFDLAVASLALIIASPVLAVAALAIKLDSPGPVFFRQLRVGLDGRLFTMVKLRTMRTDAEAVRAELLDRNEADGPLFKIAADPRITRVGRILRRLSIDEIPQFWNVIEGSMSIVGPRPALPSEVAEWDPELHDRLRVLPGITGMWQVSGRSGTTFEEYRRLDLYYVDNWSLVHDLRIVLRTFHAVVAQRGAS